MTDAARSGRRGLPPGAFDRNCTLCVRLASHLARMREQYPDYYNLPVPPFGDSAARLIVVGLAPGAHGANASGRPFTGDFAGLLLYRTLHEAGFASAPVSTSADDTLRLIDCRITNAVKCLPPANKPTTPEVDECNRYLKAELAGVRPGTVLLALGAIAHRAVLRVWSLKLRDHAFAHGALHELPGGVRLLDSYHCSRYNTQTRRLTESMFRDVVEKARILIHKAADPRRR